jgi:ankyrin repeat protein
VERLLETNPEAAAIPDSEHYLPLHHACEQGCNSQIIAALLEKYPSAAYAMTRKQDSALSLACTCNKSVETVRLLIQANPGALVKKNDYGFAPLHCVCRAYQPRMGIVRALLDACPDCVTLKTHGGETPVHLACSNSGAFVGVLQLLTMAQKHQRAGDAKDWIVADRPMTNKVGNTPCKFLSWVPASRLFLEVWHTD